MLELNKVLLVGNLTRDPEVKYLPSGMAVAELRLAVSRRWFDRNSGEKREETVFIDVSAWERLAEFCKNYLQKGRAVFVEGRLKMDSWEDKQGGGTRTKISVVADRVQFADSRPQEGQGAGNGGNAGAGSAGFQERPAPSEPSAAPRRSESTEDDLPF